MLDFLGTLQRTHNCGELRAASAGESVILMGWVNRRRDHVVHAGEQGPKLVRQGPAGPLRFDGGHDGQHRRRALDGPAGPGSVRGGAWLPAGDRLDAGGKPENSVELLIPSDPVAGFVAALAKLSNGSAPAAGTPATPTAAEQKPAAVKASSFKPI